MPPSMPFCSTLTGVAGAGDLSVPKSCSPRYRSAVGSRVFLAACLHPFGDGAVAESGVGFLTVDGEPAYELGNQCDTCVFFFERLDGANGSVQVGSMGDRLRAGITELDQPLLDAVAPGLPLGEYRCLLLELAPRLVELGSSDDYFATEQRLLWDRHATGEQPHDPHTDYFRDHASGSRLTRMPLRVHRSDVSARSPRTQRDRRVRGTPHSRRSSNHARCVRPRREGAGGLGRRPRCDRALVSCSLRP